MKFRFCLFVCLRFENKFFFSNRPNRDQNNSKKKTVHKKKANKLNLKIKWNVFLNFNLPLSSISYTHWNIENFRIKKIKSAFKIFEIKLFFLSRSYWCARTHTHTQFANQSASWFYFPSSFLAFSRSDWCKNFRYFSLHERS